MELKFNIQAQCNACFTTLVVEEVANEEGSLQVSVHPCKVCVGQAERRLEQQRRNLMEARNRLGELYDALPALRDLIVKMGVIEDSKSKLTSIKLSMEELSVPPQET